MGVDCHVIRFIVPVVDHSNPINIENIILLFISYKFVKHFLAITFVLLVISN